MRAFSEILQSRLEVSDKNSCRRHLLQRTGLDLCSNDYLGFSQDPELHRLFMEKIQDLGSSDFNSVPLGAAGSRLLRGQLKVFEETEELLAGFCGREAATLFPSGYQANVGLLSSLLRPEDVIFSDQFNHASIIDGIRLSGARKKIYPHLDAQALRSLLELDALYSGKNENHQKYLKIIVTESLFSMDGDLAPLNSYVELAEEFSALLIVDEAHATGLWGSQSREDRQGGGWVQSLGLSQRVFATVHPAGKALGVGGAWVSGSAELKEYLVNFSRSFIYSTAPIPLLAILLQTAIYYWKQVGHERAKIVLERSQYLQNALSQEVGQRVCIPRVPGLIVPVLIGGNSESLALAQRLQELGFDVRAIRPPTVPEGSARLRLTVHWNQSKEDLDRLVDAFSCAMGVI